MVKKWVNPGGRGVSSFEGGSARAITLGPSEGKGITHVVFQAKQVKHYDWVLAGALGRACAHP